MIFQRTFSEALLSRGVVLICAAIGLAASVANGAAAPARTPDLSAVPPKPMREFRGVWVATVSNMDWPSKPGLPVATQKAELTDILDRAVKLHLNAVIFQVRPACDALYASRLEPWSEYLTGQMGKAPEPAYDPLAFVIEEAHRRGLELHAWFNPFRARMPGAKSEVAANHVLKAHPDWVRAYGQQRWLDPSERAAREYSLGVILDVTRRYNIDGVHLDDYFYPYKEKDDARNQIDFPDDRNWKQYLASGGKLSRGDWRRQQVNDFVQTLYTRVKAEKPFVKVGISPFGIWRPGFPPQITGLDAYDQLYADARLWLQNGWADYFTPQLYWQIQPPVQSYPALLAWWAGQNEKKHHLWIGNYSGRVPSAWRPQEIVNQVHLTRRQAGASGNIFFSMTSLKNKGLADPLGKLYWQPALAPASPWLDSQPPGKPKVAWEHALFSKPRVRWEGSGPETAWLWVLQLRTNGRWSTEIIPGREFSRSLPHSIARATDLAAITAVDRCGNLGPSALVRPK
jgi:uncharacterized lipoprotein YddW (UPF0748 family)